MLKRHILMGLTCALPVLPATGWALTSSSVTAENTLGFTSNASLSSTPDADLFDRVGATVRFPVGETANRFSARYTHYFSESQNNLLALDAASGWKSASATAHEVRLFSRSFVEQEVGTTDQSFSRYGAAWNAAWTPGESRWTFRPELEMDHYPGLGRADFITSFQFEHEFLGADSDSSLNVSFTPGANLSTTSDFSRAYLNAGVYHDRPAGEDAYWGFSLDLLYNFYLARESSTSVLTGRKGKNDTLASFSSKESTWMLSPDLYWSKSLSRAWEFRAEILGNFQSSKSGTYDFSEAQALATIRWRLGL